MGQTLETIDAKAREWIAAQQVFFVATAPLAADGLVNLSPKGGDTLRVVDAHTLAYLDLTGSGVETIAHLRENGRLVLMLCAFTGPPKIMRFHGHGEALLPEHPEFPLLRLLFPDLPGGRAIIRLHVSRVSQSCGMAVPRYDFAEAREDLNTWAARQGPAGLADYRRRKNQRSLDGLPGLES